MMIKVEFLRAYNFEYENDFYLFDTNSFDICKIDKDTYDAIEKIKKGDLSSIPQKIMDKFSKLLENDIFFGEDCFLDSKVDSDTAYLSLAPVYGCNFRCKYCFASAGENYVEKEQVLRQFTKDTLFYTLEYFTNQLFPNQKNYRIDLVSGGEPLLNFEIIKHIVEYVNEFNNVKKDSKITLWMCTNGTLLTDEINRFLSQNGVSIGISIDGNKQTHNKFRVFKDGTGTYDSVVRNYKNIKNSALYSNHYKDIWGLSVVNSQNCKVVDNLLHFKELGFKNVQFKLVRLCKENELSINSNNISNVIAEYKKLTSLLLREVENDRIDLMMMVLNDNDYFGKILKRIILKEIHIQRCWAGRKKVSICPNGDIYPCDSFVGLKQFKIGNINCTEPINWNVIDRYSVNERATCQKCSIKYICGGDCYYNVSIVDASNECDYIFCYFMQEISKMVLYLYYNLKFNNPTAFKKIESIMNYRNKLSRR